MNRILFVSKSRLENTLNEYDAVYSSVLTWKGRMDQQNSNIAQANEGASTDKYTEKTTEYMNGELSDFLGHVNITKCALAEAFTKTKGLIARSEDFVNILRGSDALNSESYEACGSSGDLATYYDDFCTYGAYTGAINDNTNSIIELGGKEEESLGNIEQELLGLKTVSVSIDGMASGIRECIKKQNYTEPLYNSLKGYCIDVGIMHRYVTSLRNTYFLASTGARTHNRSYNYDGVPTEDKEEIYTMNLKEMGYSEEDIKVLKRYTGLTASQLYEMISHMPASEVSNMIRLAYANCGNYEDSEILFEYNPSEKNNQVEVVQRLLQLAGIKGVGARDGVFGSGTAQAIIEFQKQYGKEFGLDVCDFGQNGESVYVDEKTLAAMLIVAERNTTPGLVTAYGSRANVDLTGASVTRKDDWLFWGQAQDGFTEANIDPKTGDGDNKTPYGKFMGSDGEPWCASFVSWCLFMAGDTTLPHTASTKEMKEDAIAGGIYHDYKDYKNGVTEMKNCYDPDYIPKPGDVFYRKTTEGGHVGFVGSVIDNGDGTYTIKTIEGNAGQQVAGDEMSLEEFRKTNNGVIEMNREEKTSYDDDVTVKTKITSKKTR